MKYKYVTSLPQQMIPCCFTAGRLGSHFASFLQANMILGQFSPVATLKSKEHFFFSLYDFLLLTLIFNNTTGEEEGHFLFLATTTTHCEPLTYQIDKSRKEPTFTWSQGGDLTMVPLVFESTEPPFELLKGTLMIY